MSSFRAGSRQGAGITPRRNTRPPCASTTRRSRRSPNLAEAYFRRGSLYQTMGEKALALADFERAIERDPRFAASLPQRGKICLESGDFDSALADFGMLMSIACKRPRDAPEPRHLPGQEGALARGGADFQRVLKLTNHSDFAEPAKQYLRECESSTAQVAARRRHQRLGGQRFLLGTDRSRVHDLTGVIDS